MLNGEQGVNVLTGGAGADTFVFDTTVNNTNRVTDFQQGLDQIVLQDPAPLTFGDVTITENAGNSEIAFNGRTIIIEGVTGLTAADFGFAATQIVGTPGPDTLNGTSASEEILGRADDDVINGGGGNDVLDGEDGDDTINAGNDADRLEGGDGDDVLRGNGGEDLLLGEGGNDILLGGSSSDELNGGAGADILNGEQGSNMLIGGTGADTFQFVNATVNNDNWIADFENGVDVIEISGFPGLNSFADLAITDNGIHSFVDLGGGNLITVAAFVGLDASDFLFT